MIILFHNLLIFISFYFYHLFYHLILPIEGDENLLFKSVAYTNFRSTYHLITFFFYIGQIFENGSFIPKNTQIFLKSFILRGLTMGLIIFGNVM